MSLIIDIIRKISHSLYVAAKNETLEKYAYTDELTGLSNRRRCEEIYDEIDRLKLDYILIAFDLNNWNMSTAYGICYASENKELTIRQANKIADERMYQKKFEMKRKKGR